jgi:uncharacterized protein (TIGR02145 family)
MSRLLYIPRKILASLGYGCLYNWWCTQPQITEATNGYLYNFYAATDSRNIASAGWHLPTFAELSAFQTYLGGNAIAGAKLKTTGLSDWDSPNSGATNEVGFNLRGSANRSIDGTYSSIKQVGRIWSSMDFSATEGVAFTAYYNSTNFNSTIPNKKEGLSVRLVKDSTTLTHGQTSTYTDPSGITYPTICIGSQEFTACNIATRHYRNGELIPEVTVNASWAGLTSGGRCSYGNLESNAGTTKSISPVGWHVPSNPEFGTLRSYLDPAGSVQSNIAGGKLKEVGFIYWNSPNTGATNEAGFNAKGAGNRPSTFSGLGQHGHFHSTYVSFNGNPGSALLFYNNAQFWAGGTMSGSSLKSGSSIRLIKDTSDWVEGETVTDSEGNIYPTVKIGTQVWVASNWKCKQWSDGSTIPNVTDNATWGALTTPAWCYPGNDPLNA